MWFLIPIHFVIARTTISITTKKAETGDKHMQVDLFEHFDFFSYNGFLEECTITLIDKTDGIDPTREEYWRKVLKIVSS